MNTGLEKRVVALIFVMYVVLAAGFSSGPIFEGPDEFRHYDYMRVVADTRALPHPYARQYSQYHQAPFYYMLLAPLTSLLPDSDYERYDTVAWGNPFFPDIQHIVDNQNKNATLHSRDEAFPYTHNDTARNVHILRLVSVMMGLATLTVSYLIFRLVFPGSPSRRILALSITAFWPLFLWISGLLTNDALVYLLSTVSLYLLLWQGRYAPSLRLNLLLGVVLGLAISTKTSAAVLGLPTGVAVLVDRRMWRYVPVILIPTLILGGWWNLRNLSNYDDPFLTDSFAAMWPGGYVHPEGHFVLDVALKNAPNAYKTFWAQFHAIGLPSIAHTIFQGTTLVVLLGLGRSVFQLGARTRREGWAEAEKLILKQALVVVALVLGWIIWVFYIYGVTHPVLYGRQLLGGISGIAILLALGLHAWFPARFRLKFALCSSALLATIATAILAGYFLPAFRPIPLPDDAQTATIYRYENVAEMIGMSTRNPHGAPGDIVQVDFYWRALQPADSRTIIAFLTTLENDWVDKHSYPAGGNLLANEWQAGETWVERFYIQIPDDAQTQTRYTLAAGLYELATASNLEAINAAGEPSYPVVGFLDVNGTPQNSPPLDYRFGDVIGLETPEISVAQDQLEVCLNWASLQSTPVDYQVFVHVVSGDEIIAQHDQPAGKPNYPTSAWLAGEVVPECVTINLPARDENDWALHIGLYVLSSGERLPVFDTTNQGLENDFVTLRP